MKTHDNNGGNNQKSTGFSPVNDNHNSKMKKKKNRARLGGGGLSLQAFANAKSKNDGYNPALITLYQDKSGDQMGSRKKMNVEGDRLSSLPDDLIHKILSFVSTKHAVETSVLSPRWRYIWTSMPYLSFSSNDFRTLPKFSKFVRLVLSGRNWQIEVSSVELTFRGNISQAFVERILNYAFSHNVQQLSFNCLHEKKIEIPLSLFSSQSLKHLTLTGHSYAPSNVISPTWDLPALATLSLHGVTLPDANTDEGASLFSHCPNLKNLTLKNCRIVSGLNGFSIRHSVLSSLTLIDGCKGLNVVTPQLKNLTIKYCTGIHLVSAPDLASLHYIDDNYKFDADALQLSTDFLHLDEADICIYYPSDVKASANKIVSLLQQLRSVKFLTLNWELVKCLFSSVELISNQPSPFTNLKSLKIYPTDLDPTKVAMSSEVKNFLLDGSPGATFTMVSYEDVRAVIDVTTARNLMSELHELLEGCKENRETNKALTKQENRETNKALTKQAKPPMKSHMAGVHKQGEVGKTGHNETQQQGEVGKTVHVHRAQRDTNMKCLFLERMTRIESFWKDLNKLFEIGYKNTLSVISLLRRIERVLNKVPTSHRAKLQARFSSLHAEAETIMDNTMDRVKIQCDKNPSRSNVFFHKLATSSQRSS